MLEIREVFLANICNEIFRENATSTDSKQHYKIKSFNHDPGACSTWKDLGTNI